MSDDIKNFIKMIVKGALNEMSPEEIKNFIPQLHEGYCRDCGRWIDNRQCHCQNDE